MVGFGHLTIYFGWFWTLGNMFWWVLTRTQEVDSTLWNTEIYSKYAKPLIQIVGPKTFNTMYIFVDFGHLTTFNGVLWTLVNFSLCCRHRNNIWGGVFERCDDTPQTHIQVFVLQQDRFLAPGDNSCQGKEDDLRKN